MGYGVRTVSPSFVVVRALPKVCITNGQRNSLRLASDDLSVIPVVRLLQTRSKAFVVRLMI